MEVLHYGDAQIGGRLWVGKAFCHGNPVGISGGWGGKTEGTVERGAEEVGYRPGVMEGYCWWTCNVQLWYSDPRRVENWGGLVVQVSSGSWSKVRSLNLAGEEIFKYTLV